MGVVPCGMCVANEYRADTLFALSGKYARGLEICVVVVVVDSVCLRMHLLTCCSALMLAADL